MGVIWFLSSLTSSGVGELAGFVIPELVQNGAHAVVYGALAAAWAVALWPEIGAPRRIVMYCGAYGIVDELHQAFVPGRTSSVLDVVVDLLGAATVMYIITSYVHHRARLSASPT